MTRDVEDLFTEAARTLARTTRRYPVNISSINDIMRHRDRWADLWVWCVVGEREGTEGDGRACVRYAIGCCSRATCDAAACFTVKAGMQRWGFGRVGNSQLAAEGQQAD